MCLEIEGVCREIESACKGSGGECVFRERKRDRDRESVIGDALII